MYPESDLSQAYSIFRFGYLVRRESRGRRTYRRRLKDSKAVPRRLRGRRASSAYYAYSVFPSVAITALDTRGSSIWLGAFADSVSRLVTAEAIAGLLIWSAAGIT
jgi:hypothetical protein